ncbi:MAG: hypothetical protein LBC68_12930 [Prevotellaceae bacterium]|jgi:hypothetical protein|nr:hypothetical protein [Prevotellaceae bacterium]
MKTTKRKLSYWIKERHNPQFDKPYYVGLGQRAKSYIKALIKSSTYGCNCYHRYTTEEEYRNRINELISNGYSVQERNY